MKAGQPLRAAEAYERHYMENVSYGSTYSATAASTTAHKSAQLAGQLYVEAGVPARAIDVLVKGGFFAEAAEACMRNDQPARAAELYLRAGDTDWAIAAHEKAGNQVAAANLRGEKAFKEDRVAEAAAFFQQGRDFLRAADLFEQMGLVAEAARAYEAGEAFSAAGAVYLRAACAARPRRATSGPGSGRRRLGSSTSSNESA